MTTEVLSATLDLSTDEAMGAIQALASETESSLADAAGSASAAYADAMESAISSIGDPVIVPDVTEIEPAISGAIEGVDAQLPVEVDSGAAEEAISALAAEIESVPGQMDLFLDTSEADSQLALFYDTASADPVEIEVVADTADAQSAVEDLTSSASQMGGTMDQAAGGTQNMGQAAAFLGGAAGVATGNIGGMEGAVGGMSTGMGIAVGSAVGLGAAFGVLIQNGIEAESAAQRFDMILGNMAEDMLSINVGSLNMDLRDLAITLGTDDEALMNAAATMYQFQINAGASAQSAEEFAEQVVAIASRAVALNPALGDVASVAQRLQRGLAVGGRFAAMYGLELTATEIKSRALADTGKTLASELTIQEKAAAGAQLAVEKYGNTIGDTVAKGAENAIIVQRRLHEELNNLLEAVGRPLVIPFFDLIEASLPIVDAFATVVGKLGSGALPIVGAALTAAAVPLQMFADGLSVIASDEGLALIGVGAVIAAAALLLFTDAVLAAQSAVMAMGATLLTNPFFLAAAAITAIGVAMHLIGGEERDWISEIKQLQGALADANGALDAHAQKLLRTKLENRGQVDDLNRANVSWKQWITAIESAGGATDKQIDTMKRLAIVVEGGDSTNLAFVESLKKISPELGAVAAQLAKHGELNQGIKETLIEEALAQAEATRQVHENVKAGADQTVTTDRQTASLHRFLVTMQEQSDALTRFLDTIERQKAMTEDWVSSVESGLPQVSDAWKIASERAKEAGRDFINVDDISLGLDVVRSKLESFGSDIATIASKGFPMLAAQLAAQGQDAGGDMAAALAQGLRDGEPLAPEVAKKLQDMMMEIEARKAAISLVMGSIFSEGAKSIDPAMADIRRRALEGLGYVEVDVKGKSVVVQKALVDTWASPEFQAFLGNAAKETGRQGGTGVAEGAIQGADATADAVKAAIGRLLDAPDAAPKAKEGGRKGGQAHGQGAKEGVDAEKPNVDASINNLLTPSAVFDAQGSGQLLGQLFGTGVALGVALQAGLIAAAATAVIPTGGVGAEANGSVIGGRFGASLAEGIASQQGAVQGAAVSIIPTGGIGAEDWGNTIGHRFGSSLAEGILGEDGNIHGAAAGVIPTGGIGAEDWGNTIGGRWGNAVASGISGTAGTIQGAAQGVIPTGGLGAEDAGFAIGSRFSSGVASGMLSHKDEAFAAGQAVAQAAKDGLASGGSPSIHLFLDQGRSFTEALARGMTENARLAIRAGQVLARAAVPTPPPSVGVGGGGTNITVPSVQINLNLSGDSRRDVEGARRAGTTAGRAFMQTVRSSGRR